jgi:hypothetical protein
MIRLVIDRASRDGWARNETRRTAEYANWRFHFDHLMSVKGFTRFFEDPDDGQRRPSNGSGLQDFAQGAMSGAGKPLKGILER